MASAPPHVVILGGGFAGLYTARGLARSNVRITLVDRENHHLFQPLLYQVATAALNPSDIAAPIRRILRRQKNVEVFFAEARSVDAAAKTVRLADSELSYDYLVVATGATHSYFGRDDWAPFAPGLKTVDDALEIRRRMLRAFELAEREPDPVKQGELLTFVIVGGGATGVEMAGAFAEISRRTLVSDFRHIDPAKARVLLLEGADRVLPNYPPDLSQKALKQLEGLGVEVRLKTRVTGIDDEAVSVGEERIPAKVKVWAAGVAASALVKSLGAPLDRAGRVKVNADLTIPGHPEIFVIGDVAAVQRGDGFVPGVAPAAIQEGNHTAKNLRRALDGKPLEPFSYFDKGSLATIGKNAAVADFGHGLHLSGFLAWLAWAVVHILFLIGFRNRVLVVLEWMWAYLFHERGARLITGVNAAPPPLPPAPAKPVVPVSQPAPPPA